MRHLIEGVAHLKNIVDMRIFFSFTKSKQVYELNKKHQYPCHLLHLDQQADMFLSLFRRQTQ